MIIALIIIIKTFVIKQHAMLQSKTAFTLKGVNGAMYEMMVVWLTEGNCKWKICRLKYEFVIS
jgi:hypothetical protein